LSWIGGYVFQEGSPPTNDAVVRSIGVTVIPLISLMVFGFAWMRYERFLNNIERSGKEIKLWKELPLITLLGFSPIGILFLFSPSEALEVYPMTLNIERYGVPLAVVFFLVYFYRRTRSQ
jgi:hypothetical protein